MSPLVLFPGELFSGPFYAPTLEGQYVLKDVVLISAGLVIGTTLQGGSLVSGRAHRSAADRGHGRNTPSESSRRQYTGAARFKA